MKKVIHHILLFFYRIYEIIIGLPIFLLSTIITCTVTAIGCKLGDRLWWSYHPAKYWSKIMCYTFFIRVKVVGIENARIHKTCVFVANHQSSWDIFVVYGYLRHNFLWMMKKSLRKVPFIGWATESMGQVFVDNSTPAATKLTMENAEQRLKEGRAMVIFPEGTRTLTGRIARFKRGSFILAKEFNLPIVPVTIDGAFDVYSKKAIFPNFGKITLTIHEPILPPEGGHDINDLVKRTHAIVSSALPERCQQYPPKAATIEPTKL